MRHFVGWLILIVLCAGLAAAQDLGAPVAGAKVDVRMRIAMSDAEAAEMLRELPLHVRPADVKVTSQCRSGSCAGAKVASTNPPEEWWGPCETGTTFVECYRCYSIFGWEIGCLAYTAACVPNDMLGCFLCPPFEGGGD